MANFTQNHSGSGNNVINFGRPKFVMSDAVADEAARLIRAHGLSDIEIVAVGPQRSCEAAAALQSLLAARGIASTYSTWIMNNAQANELPVEVRGNKIFVDVSK